MLSASLLFAQAKAVGRIAGDLMSRQKILCKLLVQLPGHLRRIGFSRLPAERSAIRPCRATTAIESPVMNTRGARVMSRQIHHWLEAEFALHAFRAAARFALAGIGPDMHAYQSVL